MNLTDPAVDRLFKVSAHIVVILKPLEGFLYITGAGLSFEYTVDGIVTDLRAQDFANITGSSRFDLSLSVLRICAHQISPKTNSLVTVPARGKPCS